MNWKDITVEQYQEVVKIIREELTDLEKEVKIVSLLLDITEKQIDDLTLDQYKDLVKQVSFIYQPIPGKAVKYLKVNGRKYKINYKVQKIRFAQYVEVMHFSHDYIENLHLLMASVVNPVKWFRVQMNDSSNHERVSEDMKQVRFIDAYHTAVFFYRVWRGSIKLTQDYLISQMMATEKISQPECQEYMESLQNVMDGFITPRWLPTLKISA